MGQQLSLSLSLSLYVYILCILYTILLLGTALAPHTMSGVQGLSRVMPNLNTQSQKCIYPKIPYKVRTRSFTKYATVAVLDIMHSPEREHASKPESKSTPGPPWPHFGTRARASTALGLGGYFKWKQLRVESFQMKCNVCKIAELSWMQIWVCEVA